MKHSQQGLTTIGWMAVIAIAGTIFLTAFKVIPMYLEYYTARSLLDSLVTDTQVDVTSRRSVWDSLNKRLKINQVESVKKENVTISREGGVTKVSLDYRAEKPYFAQLFIGGHFTYTVEITR